LSASIVAPEWSRPIVAPAGDHILILAE